jgi:hypothetical protein
MREYHSRGEIEQRSTSQGKFRSFFIFNADWPYLVSKLTVLTGDLGDDVDKIRNLKGKDLVDLSGSIQVACEIHCNLASFGVIDKLICCILQNTVYNSDFILT